MSPFQIVVMISVCEDTAPGGVVACVPTNHLGCNNLKNAPLKIHTNL